MSRPLNDSPYLYGLHDPGGEHLMAERDVRGWILFTEELGCDPNDARGTDYSRWADQGFGIMARLNHGYEPNGTIPRADRYLPYSQRVANFVRSSRGCHIWIIGNEMNFAVERPGVALDWSTNPPRIVSAGEIILPEMYAACYTQCRQAIKSLSGHASDQVITGAVAPWNVQTAYAGNPTGDWVTYQTDILAALGPQGCDGIAIHAYTHGADPNLIHTSSMMEPPFTSRQYNFRVYQDFMNGIPSNMRHLPVYLTEIDQNDAWHNANRGWIQRAYGEIDWWNRQAGTQIIRAVVLYRWPNLDRWGIEGKTALHADFGQAIIHRYNWETAMQAKPRMETQPVKTAVAKPAMIDITDQLARDATKLLSRTRSDIKYIVVNHTAVRPDISASQVANAQRQRWPGIMSQFYITGDGEIQRTHPDEVAVSDQPWIFNSLHIYVAGNFDETVPGEIQLNALAHLCAWLLDVYDLKTDALRGACEFVDSHSPGLQWLDGARWKNQLLALVASVPGSPAASSHELVTHLRTEIERLSGQVQSLTDQVEKLTGDNNTLKTQLKAAEADRQALRAQVSELQARIAELTQSEQVAAPAIRDLTSSLPKHTTEIYETRSLNEITTLAIHHSAASGDIPPRNVAAYHVSRGWPGIGYHFYITTDGTLYQCNGLETISFHVGEANPYSVGICIAGRFMDGTIPPETQLTTAARLISYLAQKLNVRLENVKGHKELPKTETACPGSDWLEGKHWKARLLAEVLEKAG